MKGCEIGAEGARMISEALKSNNTLTTLYLSSEGQEMKRNNNNNDDDDKDRKRKKKGKERE